MKKFLIVSTAIMAQRLSVLGIEMGTSIDKAEKILRKRYGGFKVYRTDNVKLSVYSALVGGSEFRSIDFEFQCDGNATYTYLCDVTMQKDFREYSSAKSMFNTWDRKLGAKYTIEDIQKYKNNGGVHDDIAIYYKEGLMLVLSYGESKGGDMFWYVHVKYHENFVDESNDY
jgi:hypothetical protein